MKKVWFNHGMSLLADVFDVVKAVGDTEICIVCSHSDPEFVGRANSDHFVVEPADLDREGYIQYCLEFAENNEIDLFIPSRQSSTLAGNRELFSAIGVAMLVAGDSQTLDLIYDKVACYKALGRCAVPIPDYRVFSDLSGFEQAYAEISVTQENVCFKPVSGVFARGFRIIAPDGSSFERLLDSGPYTATKFIGLSETRMTFAERSTFEPFMLMEYLDGQERSVDCIAMNGKLVRRIIRLKDSHSTQYMEDNSLIDELVEEIIAELRLDGIFNVQFKSKNDVPYFLEINSRMSGGLPKACLASQFALPYWAIRLALGTVAIADVPFPTAGAFLRKEKVYTVQRG